MIWLDVMYGIVEYKSEVTSKPPLTLFVNIRKKEHGHMMLTDRLDIARSRWKGFVKPVDKPGHTEGDFEEMTDESTHYHLYSVRHSETRRKIA